jgi:kinetochore protein NNF1
MANDEPASPPLPEKHVAATPGPRATRLRDLYAQALEHTLGKLAWDNFAACYPTIGSRAEGVLRQVQAQMVGKLGEKCEKEFDSIVASRQVVSKLNELEALIADAQQRRSAATDETDPIPYVFTLSLRSSVILNDDDTAELS